MGKKIDNMPSQSFFRAMNEMAAERFARKVAEELEERPDLVEALGDRVQSFITWAGESRLDYKPDLDEEVGDFLSSDFRNRIRLHKLDPQRWKVIRMQVFARDNYTCHYCGTVGGELECDHIIPFSKGGSDDMDNLVTACLKCNRSKKDKSYEEFISHKPNEK
jgi:hypothetical protein